MFNFEAQQIFVVHPHHGGGGIVSAILSLDKSTAALNLQNLSSQQKAQNLLHYFEYPKSSVFHVNAHPYGHINFAMAGQLQLIEQAESAYRYVHKTHFYNLFDTKAQQLLQKMPQKFSVGIVFTDECIIKVHTIRKFKQRIDHYQKWIYDNQKTLLPQYFGIDCKHTIEFRDLLEENNFLDHILYCCKLFDLEINMSLAKNLIQEWHKKLLQ